MGQTAMRSRRTVFVFLAVVAALVLSSGVALAITEQCQADIDCLGTNDPDTLEGSDGHDRIFGRGGGDTLRGFGSYDHLFGQGGGDTLFGGPDGDYLIGGAGKDELNGGGGYDEFYFGAGWGEDSIIDDSTSGNGVVFSGGYFQDVSVTEDLTIRFVPGAGPEVKNQSGTNTVNWESNVMDYVHGGAGDDEITGSPSGNLIRGGLGVDTISGAGGDDEIDVDDGLSGDMVNCGEDLIGGPDKDRVRYDLGDTVSPNCEVKIPAS